MRIYGPYQAKDKRYRCLIKHDDGTKTTISYPRLIMENYLGKILLPEQDVHHKDGNVENNDISNLKVILKSEHVRNHSIKYTESINVLCFYCGVIFILLPIRQMRRKQEEKRGKSGPFCSRICSGKYGSDMRGAAKQGCLG